MVREDREERLRSAYVADCLGMIARMIHGNSELPLYSELLKKEKKPEETAEQVTSRILGKLGWVPEKGDANGSVRPCGEDFPG